GDDLRVLIDHARRMRSLMNYVPRRYDPAIVEAFALVGALDEALDDEQRVAAVEFVAEWLTNNDDEATWGGRIAENGDFELQRRWRGVTDVHRIDHAFIRSAEARKLQQLAAEQAENYALTSRLISIKAAEADDGEDDAPAGGTPITRPSELLAAILASGRKGLSVQRYKGLGEMNAEQLWETTLDPDVRSLLRVEIEQADVADEIFTQLMGDVVEPRREFIQDNALNVANLDV
ncbi:MAG: DNA gyrase subunit B, partial [Sphingomonadaceae bacterium]|nr:DNA gyrase subunit B [Sphingomonadaceae bacterium]